MLDQASKIAESLDTSEGEVFKDFDLVRFLDHFDLNPVIQMSLLLACQYVMKQDLKLKGTFAIISSSRNRC